MVDILRKFTEEKEDKSIKEHIDKPAAPKKHRIRKPRVHLNTKIERVVPEKDRTGQVFKAIQVIKELGNNKIIGKCLVCNQDKEFKRDTVVYGRLRSCGCVFDSSNIGKVINNLEVINITKKGYKYKCVKCNKEYEVDSKRKANLLINRGCCIESESEEPKDTVILTFKLLKELGNGHVRVQCTKCGATREYTKTSWKKGIRCTSCSDNRDELKEIKAVLKVKNDLGFGRIFGTCSNCNVTREYRRYDIESHRLDKCKCCKAKIENIIE